MKAASFLQLLFAALISLGLVIAPLSSPLAVANHMSDDGMMQMADVAGDMPCCPHKQKPADCQDCPLFAVCMVKLLLNRPSDGLPIREAEARALRPVDEPVLAGLARPPPDQPPRTSV
ncbi:hypothetical protein [Bradyrhizobium sp. Tv2a-2]|uniref:hypothetical protein n=1 Tax=Bradyrhizobium sp. Tv2a-2 TaxID=113395 RepID=UPI000415E119|nr:hypothetical protein [Bradyrhizobium sp. Tv2a-2]